MDRASQRSKQCGLCDISQLAVVGNTRRDHNIMPLHTKVSWKSESVAVSSTYPLWRSSHSWAMENASLTGCRDVNIFILCLIRLRDSQTNFSTSLDHIFIVLTSTQHHIKFHGSEIHQTLWAWLINHPAYTNIDWKVTCFLNHLQSTCPFTLYLWISRVPKSSTTRDFSRECRRRHPVCNIHNTTNTKTFISGSSAQSPLFSLIRW